MTKRRLIIGLTLLVLAAVGAVIVLAPQAGSRISRENFERLQEGMTLAEVEAILGEPGVYSNLPIAQPVWPDDGREIRTFAAPEKPYDKFFTLPAMTCREWCNDKVTVGVYFGTTDRVEAVLCRPTETEDRGRLGNLRWRMEMLWERWFR